MEGNQFALVGLLPFVPSALGRLRRVVRSFEGLGGRFARNFDLNAVGSGPFPVRSPRGGGGGGRPIQTELPNMPQPEYPSIVNYGMLDVHGRPSGVQAILQAPIKMGPDSRSAIRHWQPHFNEGLLLDRTHLLARTLGGGNRPENLVPFSSVVNQDPKYGMRFYEDLIASAVGGGQTVDLSVTPIYRGGDVIPRGIEIRAVGSGKHPLDIWFTFLNHPFSPNK